MAPAPPSIADLLQQLSDPDPAVRAQALRRSSLWTHADADWLAALIEDEDEADEVRDAATVAISGSLHQRVGQPRHAPLLVRRLMAVAATVGPYREEDERNEAFDRLFGAMKALQHVGDARAVDPLLELTRHENTAVRAQAGYTLSVFDDPRIVPALEALIADPSTPRQVARELEKQLARRRKTPR